MISSFPQPRAAYIHVPFCAHRCGYCDFTLVAGKDHLIDAYLQALELQLRQLETPRPVETLFCGGGTPTHLSAGQLRRLMELIETWFPRVDGYEFSVEANPAGFDDEKMAVLAEAGVNRISLGVQSFDSATLELLERDHRAEGVVATVERLRRYFSNVSLDLIFGVPSQTLPLWKETLQRALALEPQHISTYGLTFEKGTSFWTRREQQRLMPVTEDLEREMYAAAIDELTAVGFEHYEISNFARPGYRCRHNEVYWRGQPYYGFGPGAARYLDGRRETNHRSVTTWLKRVQAGQSPMADAERLSDEDRAREMIVLGLRHRDGVNRQNLHAQTGYRLDDLAGEAVQRYRQAGLIEDDGDRIRLTREGLFVADTVIVDFL
jgi:oxygen-independent coproporphyrinogen III oxidase